MSPETNLLPPKTPFELGVIGSDPEAQAKRGWTVMINGEIVPVVSSLSIRHDKMGIDFNYGQHPDGYDSIGIHEQGGGGAATVPYAIIEGQLMIGVVAQKRVAAGGVVLEIPRGFLDLGETHDETALRETKEETGLDVIKSRLEKLGSEMNPNSTFFNTSREGEGVSYYAIQVLPNELDKVTMPDGSSHYTFTEAIRAQAEGDKTTERILGSKFISLQEAKKYCDMFTGEGVYLLVAQLFGNNVLRFAGVEAPKPIEKQIDTLNVN